VTVEISCHRRERIPSRATPRIKRMLRRTFARFQVVLLFRSDTLYRTCSGVRLREILQPHNDALRHACSTPRCHCILAHIALPDQSAEAARIMFTKLWWQVAGNVLLARLVQLSEAGFGALTSSALKSAGERVPVPQLLPVLVLTLAVSISIAALLALVPGQWPPRPQPTLTRVPSPSRPRLGRPGSRPAGSRPSQGW
jgi:hypothetical protein